MIDWKYTLRIFLFNTYHLHEFFIIKKARRTKIHWWFLQKLMCGFGLELEWSFLEGSAGDDHNLGIVLSLNVVACPSFQLPNRIKNIIFNSKLVSFTNLEM